MHLCGRRRITTKEERAMCNLLDGCVQKEFLPNLKELFPVIVSDENLKDSLEILGILEGGPSGATLCLGDYSQTEGAVTKDDNIFHGLLVTTSQDHGFWIFPVRDTRGIFYKVVSEKMLADAGYAICAPAGAVA